MMNSRERLLAALNRQMPDRLPVTTHHLMPSFLARIGGISEREFFDRFGLDAIRWNSALRADLAPAPDWRIESAETADADYHTVRFRIVTPRGTLSTVLQDDGRTEWVRERLVKHKSDIDLIARFAPVPP
jgi:uroporphyrinogen decarboxylase